jgi:acetylornithine deacetylase/succinyl-diaminopimelate desuccinylase-like protein
MRPQILSAALACLALAGCASIPAREPPALDARLDVARAALPEARAGREAIELLSDYLRVDTSNPPGNEARGARFLASVLEREGIAHELVDHGHGRASLIARLPGSGPEPPLCLLSHIDVVPADPAKWRTGRAPFDGVVADGYVWGRGALDMKGLGVLELLTMVWLKRLALPLRRSVVLLAVAGEETDNFGARTLVDRDWDRIGCSHAINEGGLAIEDMVFDGQTVHAISVAEKGVLWLRVTAKGEPGHGSTPLPGRAPDRLVHALSAIEERRPDIRVHRSIYDLLAQIGHEHGGVSGFVLARPELVDLFALGKLEENPLTHAALVDTVNLTGLSGMNEPNVVPAEVHAVLDCRLLPGSHADDLIAELESLVDDDGVTFTILQKFEATESPWQDDPVFAAIAREAVGGRKGVVAGPVLSPGFTDSTFLRRRGVRAYGFVPFEVPKEELAGYHGRNERVSVENVVRGLRTLYRVVVDVAVDPARVGSARR